jgi:Spy/CpxP family protein refolding chaperone
MKSLTKRVAASLLALSLAGVLAAQAAPQAAKPPKGPAGGPPQASPAANYTIEQSVSDQAQLSTISFSALAFMTGTFGADTFLPPGKAADYFGFQYMRDIDVKEAGHNQMFLGKIGNATLAILDEKQEAILLDLAKKQESGYQDLAKKRLVVIKAFRDNLEGAGPAGNTGLSKTAVQAAVAGIFAVDGQLAYDRAVAYGKVANSLTAAQKASFSKLAFGDSSTWPTLEDQYDKRTMSHGQDVLFMTYASEFFSWYAGNENADVYFCPERHGTYFGGFYMKDYPAMGNNDYFIPTALTGDSGKALLSDILTTEQAATITGIMTPLKPILDEILSIRRQISQQFRGVLAGKAIDYDRVMALSRRYGELDGLQSWEMATRFAAVYRTLTADQKAAMARLRNQDVFPKGYYLYSDPVDTPVAVDDTALFSK